MNPNNLAEDIRQTELAMDRRNLRKMDFASPAFLRSQSLRERPSWIWRILVIGIVTAIVAAFISELK